MDLNEKKVLVFGAGISGEAAAGLLLRQGARVIFTMEIKILICSL